MRKLEFGWFLPTRGDTDDYGEPLKIAAGLDMFERVAIAAEAGRLRVHAGPRRAPVLGRLDDRRADDRASDQVMRMLIAARPSYINPVLLAKMITTCDQLSQGRISVNLIAGQSETENIAEGVRWSKEQRYEIMDEEVSILKALWTQTGPTDWNGKYYTLKQAELTPKPFQKPYPKFYLGGGSGQAAELSAKHSDVHLFWGDTVEQIAANMKVLREHGREARPRARSGFRHAPADRVPREREGCVGGRRRARPQRNGGTQDYIQTYYASSVANQRVQELARTMGDLIAPNLWSGLTKARPGPASASSAIPSNAPACCSSYIDIGCHSFCLSGYLHDAEAERFHRLVRPILADRNRGRMPS